MDRHQANAAVLQRAFDAFNSGDMSVFPEVWTADIRWHQPPGDGPLAGDFTGIEATLGMFGRAFELSDGTFKAEADSVMGGDSTAAAIMKITAQRDGESLSTTSILSATLTDGKIGEVWHLNEDPEAFHAFFSA